MNEIGPHFEVRELRQILERGFEAPDRGLQSLLHFSSGCKPCQGRLRELAHEDAPLPPRTMTGRERFASVVLALCRLVEAERDPHSTALLRPVHRYRIRNGLSEPPAFSRLLLEESHRYAFSSPEVVKTAGELISERRLRRCDDRRFHDLRGLALTYLGEHYRLDDSNPEGLSNGRR